MTFFYSIILFLILAPVAGAACSDETSKKNPVYDFGMAFKARKEVVVGERTSVEFELSKSLYASGNVALAFGGFSTLAARTPKKEWIHTQLKAIECLTEIQEEHKSFKWKDRVVAQFPRVLELTPSAQKKVVLRAAFSAFLESYSLNEAIHKALKGSGRFETLAYGLQAVQRGDSNQVISNLESFFLGPRDSFFEKYEDTARLLLARAYYSAGQTSKAIFHYRKVSKRSNDFSDALNEVSIAYLVEGNYPRAIGSAVALQKGVFKRVFAPEAALVIGAGLNETCQYPKALDAIKLFKKQYQPVFAWIKTNWMRSDKSAIQPYDELLKVLSGKWRGKVEVPEKILSEWLRSKVFLNGQEEMNLYSEVPSLQKNASVAFQKKMKLKNREIRSQIRNLKKTLVSAIKDPSNDKKAKEVSLSLEVLDSAVDTYFSQRKSEKVWRKLAAKSLKINNKKSEQIVKNINQRLLSRIPQMLSDMKRIKDAYRLVEVEVFDGAGSDLVWRNAFPDYAKIVDEQFHAKKTSSSDGWNWGTLSFSDEENEEIWEDELGEFVAGLRNECQTKSQFLAAQTGKDKR